MAMCKRQCGIRLSEGENASKSAIGCSDNTNNTALGDILLNTLRW